MSNHRGLWGWGLITFITTYCLFVAFGRNLMCAKSQAALSVTQTQAPFGNTWRLCMALRLMSPRSSVGTCIPGPHLREILAAILSPGHLAGRLREPLGSRRTSATLPQSGRSASRWRRSRPRNPWYVIHSPDFPRVGLGSFERAQWGIQRAKTVPILTASGHSDLRRSWAQWPGLLVRSLSA